MKKKLFLSKIIFYSFLFLMIGSLTTNSIAIIVDKWSVVEEEDISPAFVFSLWIHSWFETEHLSDYEFLFGDVLDFCTIRILRKKPIDLEISPEKIKFTSPSKKVYEFELGGKEDYFDVGKFTTDKEEAMITLNESGLWSINIIFDNKNPLALITYSGYYDFTNDSRIHIFYGLNFNVYTNLEYQQLRATKALEESAKAAEGSKIWAIASFIALSGAAFIAALSIIFNYLHKRREINAECKFKVLEHLLDLKNLIQETYKFLNKIKSNDYQYVNSGDYETYENIKNRYYELRRKLSPDVTYALTFPEARKISKIINDIFIELTVSITISLESLSGPPTEKTVNEAEKDLKKLENLIIEFLNTKIKLYGISKGLNNLNTKDRI